MDWSRFNTYAARVNTLYYDDTVAHQDVLAVLSATLVADLFLHRPAADGVLLPNLCNLTWLATTRQSLRQLLPFISSSVTSLDLSVDLTDMGDACAKVIHSLSSRGLCLSSFTLIVRQLGENFLNELSAFLIDQKSLVEVALPHFSAVGVVVRAMETLPLLESYMGCSFVDKYQAPFQAGATFGWRDGTFRVLQVLHLCASLPHATQVFGGVQGRQIKDVRLTCRSLFEQATLQEFASTIATVLPNIESLQLALFLDENDPTFLQPIQFHSIRPLLQCGALSTLKIWHNLPLAYTAEDIVTMGKAWPRMRVLDMCSDPICEIDTHAGVDLHVLDIFAANFREVEELGIFIKSSGDALKNKSRPAFNQLKELRFGTSPPPSDASVDAASEVARYLSKVCIAGVEVYAYRSPPHVRATPYSIAAEGVYSKREEFWYKVSSNVALVQNARKELVEEN